MSCFIIIYIRPLPLPSPNPDSYRERVIEPEVDMFYFNKEYDTIYYYY